MSLNDLEYWNYMFSYNWDSRSGRAQTSFFYKLILANLPEIYANDIMDNKLSICDIGCAEGDGVALLQLFFEDSYVIGTDFSKIAIEKAQKFYPDLNFKCEDMLKMEGNYDVLISSNVLEHFENPFAILTSLIAHANKYFIFLVPFNEINRCAEHLYTFNDGSIPSEISDFKLVYNKIMNTATMKSTSWSGNQLLCVFSKNPLH